MARRWQVFSIVSAAVFLSSLDLFIVNIAFPDLRREFEGSTLAGLAWILDGYAIVFAALLVPAGRIADRLGRRRVFLAGMALFTAASALCALAPTLETLVAGRVLQAVGGAMVVPTSLGLLLPEFPPEQRAKAVGLWAAMAAVGAAAGPPVGGLLVEASWRWVFLVALPVGVIALVAGARVLREIREDAAVPAPDLLGSALFAGAVGALVLGIVESEPVAYAVAAVALVAFAARSASHPSPVIEPALLRHRDFALANVATLLFFGAFGAMVLAASLFLTGVWGYSALEAGLALAPGPVMAAVGSVVGGRIVAAHGSRAAAVPGALLFAAAMASLLWVGPTSEYVVKYLPGNLAGGFGIGLAIAAFSGAIAASLPPHRFATGTAVFSMSRQVGLAIGVAVLIAIVDGGGDPVAAYHDAWLAMAVTGAGVAALALRLGGAQKTSLASVPPPAGVSSATVAP